jgi:NADH-quinone oxidoreductase subunit H
MLAMYSTLAERKVAAWLQDRVGPNRAGKGGLLQPLADGKLFAKEEFEPDTPNRFCFFYRSRDCDDYCFDDKCCDPLGIDFIFSARISYYRQLTLDALLYLIGVMSIGVYGIMIGGWASNNKFSLIGAVRAASQMISYEVAMGLSLIALLMMTGTLSLNLSATVWNELECFLPTIIVPDIFNLCVCRNQSNSFDLAECETELIGGYHTEYSSMKMGFYLFAEYANMFISSTILAVLFFGGYNYPGMSWAVENWGVNLANV